jgi:hypothetical protein
MMRMKKILTRDVMRDLNTLAPTECEIPNENIFCISIVPVYYYPFPVF